MTLTLECGDCWAMRTLAGLGDLGACPKHATPAQREAANKQILRLAEQPLKLVELARELVRK